MVRCGALVAGLTLGATALAAPLDDLAKAAEKAGSVAWYESSPAEQADKVIAAFNRKYPNVKVRQTRIVGGNELAVRSVQEMQARGYTGDALTGGAMRYQGLSLSGAERRAVAEFLSGRPAGTAAASAPWTVMRASGESSGSTCDR